APDSSASWRGAESSHTNRNSRDDRISRGSAISSRAMVCRNCGTEIADKAIICYRCGTATTDPVRKPAAVRPRTSPFASLVALVLLILLGLYLGTAGQSVLPPRRGYGLGIGDIIVFLILRIVRRR